ncbi:MAG: murein hydrolase activator EnvC family protein [Thainema sp.]
MDRLGFQQYLGLMLGLANFRAKWRRWLQAILLGGLTFGLIMSGMGNGSVVRSQPAPTIALTTSHLFATSVDDLRQKQQQIDNEHQRVQSERERLKNLEESAEDRLEGLQQTIQSTTVQIKDNEYRLELATQRLKHLQADLLVAEETYDQMQRSTVARLQFLQRQQGVKGWAVLLQSQNLNEFLDKRRQLKLVYEADQHMLGKLDETAKQLEQQRLEVEVQKNEIALIVQQLELEKQQYEAQAQTQTTLVDRLRVDRQALEAAEAKLAKDSEGVADLIRQKLAEQEAARLAADRNRIITSGSGQFSYPVSASITSSFGTRIHPILGYRRFHAGVDFGASHGSTIRAADSGTVIFSGWYGGYGRSVIISHGGGLTTLYAHASATYVKEGTSVQKGEPIAAVGSTGLSTGPHLHFEVRKNGEPVNPMSYL